MAPSQRGSRSSDNPGFNPGSIASTGVQDILRDIMPVLARLQMRAPQMPSPGPASPLSAEAAAAVALVSDMGADSLRRLTAYLDAHAGKFEGLRKLCSARHDGGPCAGGGRLRTILHLDFRCLSRHRRFPG